MNAESNTPTIIKRTRRGWMFPSGIEVTSRNTRFVLTRIPLHERKAIQRKRTLLRLFREAVGQQAASEYGKLASKVLNVQRNWWALASHRQHFKAAWHGYCEGVMPKRMLDCAVAMMRDGRFGRGLRIPRVQHAFGPFVLSTLLCGWSESDDWKARVGITPDMEIPIPLERAYCGPDADQHMEQCRQPSWCWQPGLVFDADCGLFVPPEQAVKPIRLENENAD